MQEKTKNPREKNPRSKIIALVLKLSLLTTFATLFIFKDSLAGSSSLAKIFLAISLLCQFASTVIGIANLLKSIEDHYSEKFYNDKEQTKKNHFQSNYSYFLNRFFSARALTQYQVIFFFFGFFTSILFVLRGFCPMWPFC